MKNALILHGTGDNSTKNWFSWLKVQLEQRDFKVWSPDLPHSEKPNIRTYNNFIFRNEKWHFNKDSVLIGHSSGAVAILGILQHLPENMVVDTCILVGAFKNDLGWDALPELFIEPFDFVKIKKHSKRIIFVHSDDDPYCPLEHAQFLTKQLNAELHVIPGQKHFSIGSAGEKYKQFPLLLELLK